MKMPTDAQLKDLIQQLESFFKQLVEIIEKYLGAVDSHLHAYEPQMPVNTTVNSVVDGE